MSVSCELDYFVDGMDCASCVGKVERLVAGLPGTAGVQTSFARQTLHLTLDESRTPRATLEGRLRGLGYTPRPLTPSPGPAAQDASSQPAPGTLEGERARPWYASAQGRLVLGSGLLLALAFSFGFPEPRLAAAGYVAATLLGCWPLARKALAAARLGDPFSINTLVSVAAVGAVLIGQAAEGAVVVFLFAVGELLEGVAAAKARAGIRALSALAPRTALLLEGGELRDVPSSGLRVGQTVQVRPGDRVPADGVILSGGSSLDDSPLTGESVPAWKEAGERVFAGSISLDGLLTLRVDRAADDSAASRIIRLVEEAEASRAPTARFIDRFSRAYTPGVVLVAGLVAAVPPLLGADWHSWLYRGISLLLIGCPCALVLSVPAAITSALSAGARRGLLVKGGAALESAARVRTVAFDKTGTLTAGTPRVSEVIGLGEEEPEVLRLAASVEAGSSHPLGRAIAQHAAGLGLAVPAAVETRALPGRAVSATVAGRFLTVGSPREAGPLPAGVQRAVDELEAEGRTVVILGDGAAPLGLIALRDEPRPEARATLAELRGLGLRTVMLTGDNIRAGAAVARELGLEGHAGLLPGDKLDLVRELRASGGVMMVGDGINDAPALALSDVGVAMGGGTDVALETADAALLRGGLGGVPDLLHLARATMSNIRLNIGLALGLKLVFLVGTLLGHTSLWAAILADTGATALVTANALRLLSWRGRKPQLASRARWAQRPAPAPGEVG